MSEINCDHSVSNWNLVYRCCICGDIVPESQAQIADATNERLLDRIKAAESTAAHWQQVAEGLAEALRAVEWLPTKYKGHYTVMMCPWCGGMRPDYWNKEDINNAWCGHTPDCPRQSALAAYDTAQGRGEGE